MPHDYTIKANQTVRLGEWCYSPRVQAWCNATSLIQAPHSIRLILHPGT